MNGLITPNRLNAVMDFPIYFAATELKRSKSVHLAQIPLVLGQRLLLRSLTLQLVKALNPSVPPTLLNSALGYISVGVYFGSMLTSPLALAKLSGIGSCTVNPFARHIFATPGIYSVVISNNTDNADYSVATTGSMKLYT